MGVVIEGLWDHEGYAARRLPDGNLTGTWTAATREFTAHVAACGCGWRGAGEHPPTEAGEDLAVEEWDAEHAAPLLARQAERHRAELARVLAWLGGQRDQLADPATLERLRRAAERTRDLVAEVQRDLECQPPEREAEHER
jgi:hypothetical protein